MRPVTQYPENRKLRAGREFALQTTIEDRHADSYWVKLSKGKKGNVVGRFCEGDNRGMLVFFDESEQRRLSVDHYAIVTVNETLEKFAFASFTPFLLGEWDERVHTSTVIPGEYPLYQAKNLAAAKEMHEQKLKQLLNPVVEKRVLEIESCQQLQS
jgi:hypothetical protein